LFLVCSYFFAASFFPASSGQLAKEYYWAQQACFLLYATNGPR
jgi:hypothetical protein